jgi:hypothetical protein
VAATALVVALLVAAVVVADRHRRLVDLTAERSLTLSSVTRDVVAATDGRVDITAFLGRGEPGRVEAVALLDRYRRLDADVRAHVVDPADAPGELDRLGVDPSLGNVAVRIGDRVEMAAAVTEQDVTSAVARLLRDEEVVVCVASGHGETAVATDVLAAGGFSVRDVDLLADPEVPSDCVVVVLASPTEPLGAAGRLLRSWVKSHRSLLVLADPASALDLSPLLEPFGLGIRRGLVLEGDPQSVLRGDEASPIIRRYSSANPVVRRLPPIYLPGVQEVLVDDDAEGGGLTVSRLADTSEASYLETAPLQPSFDPAADVPGPVTVAGAADRSRLDGQEIRRSRVVVVGDVDFATPAYVGSAANARFLLQAVGWLSQDERVIPLSANVPSDRPLRLTDARLAYARLLAVGIVPGLLLLGGALVWAVRRRR